MSSPEPIAIIGMACRLAGGVDSPEKFWAVLRDGVETTGELPAGRWDWYESRGREFADALRAVTRRGAFLDDVAGFDADFFGITPREAALMDPQQRIVLELAWEALEHAGIPPHRLAGTDAGVFMGVGSDDYGRRLLEDLPRIEAWTGIGGAYCGVANRVSYLLDLRGPSMAVDTACSSSLVSIHLAAQALRAGECPVALAGGVQVIAAPGLSLVLDAAGATARDGRSKSFAAGADGYGRGEGGGVLVLKRLTDARRDGDRVLAVIRGSAVHQDGRTNGIMAPNGEAQAHLMRRAYRTAGVDPTTVDYVEAHGTGTRAGDPLEAQALAAVFGPGRPGDRPLLIGSVKPNVGHLEAGAGVASVIKTVLALRHGEIPPSLHAATPNPAIPWHSWGLRVAADRTPWPDRGGPRRAAVSGYGYGGTLAHVILEAAGWAQPGDGPGAADRPGDAAGSTASAGASGVPAADPPGPALYPLSGAGRASLERHAARLADRLAGPDAPALVDVGHTLALRRTHLPYRAAIVASGREQLTARLRAAAQPGGAPVTGRPLPGARHGVVWVFSGHGSQWTGMGRELLASDPTFAGVIDRLAPLFRAELGVSPRAALLDDAAQPVDVIQSMIFAVQVALAASLGARGVRPAAVIGHSVGEIAAATTAGVLTLEQGARLVCRRSALLRRVAGQGAMALVGLPPQEAERRLRGRSGVTVAIAASPRSAVISGDAAAVEEVVERWRAGGLDVRPVDSDVAFHSPAMDPLVDALAAAAADLPPGRPRIRLYTTALADARSAAPRDGAYWAANLRGQVRLAHAVGAAVEDGYRLFLEVSPHPVVEHSIVETLEDLGVDDACVTHSLRRDRPERETLLGNLGLLHCHGAPIDWAALWPAGTLTDLPTTAWQHRPYWFEQPAGRWFLTEQHDPASHTLLGGRINVYGTTAARVWMTYLDRDSRPYPGEHPVRGIEIMPAAVLLNTFLTAAGSPGAPPDLTNVALRLPVSATNPRYLQVVLQDGAIRLSSRIAEDGDDLGWVTHTTATVEAASRPDREPRLAVQAGEPLPAGYVVDRLAALGVAAMGFPWSVPRMRRADAGLVAAVHTDPPPATAPSWAAMLDAALSIASVAFPDPPVLRMPAHIRRVVLAPVPPERARITVQIRGDDLVDVEIADEDGTVRGRLCQLRYGTLEHDSGAVADPRRIVHEIVWRPVRPEERAGGDRTGPPSVILVGPGSAPLGRLADRLRTAGVPHRVAVSADDLREDELAGDHAVVVVPAPGPAPDVGETAARASWLLARAAQRLAGAALRRAGDRPGPPRLWCVTQGVREAAGEGALGHGALWGLGRIIGGEHPEFWGGTIDVGPRPGDLTGFVDVLSTAGGEDVIALRDGRSWVPRLRRPHGPAARPPLACQPDGTYLVTGGLGALGVEVAQWLAERGARRIVLAGRRALPPRDTWDELADPRVRAQVGTIRALERLGVTVVTVRVDIADPEAATKLLSPAALGLPPIRGVVHAAGVLDNRALATLGEESLRAVLRPKVDGALVLHAMFPPGSLDFLVLFSSCGGLLGLPGQASYAAGNAFLDTLAAHRRAAGDHATFSLGWTSWRGLGMSTSSEIIDLELAARGAGDITVPEAFGAWDLVARHDIGHAAILRTLPPAAGQHRPRPLADLPVEAPERDATPPATVAWTGLRGRELRAFLTEDIRREVAATTRLPADEVDPRRPLAEMGLDSVMTVRIRVGLERRFRLPLPSTLFWDRPTIDAVAALLAERIAGAPPAAGDGNRS